MGETVLLTGGAGYIGAHTFVALRAAGYDPVILDNFSNADRDVTARLSQVTGGPVPCEEADILDRAALDRVFETHRPAAVVHFAAKKAVGQSVREPFLYFENNSGGLLSVVGAMRDHGVKTIVFSSSATVYGTPEALPIPETAPLSFTNPYGFTKLMGEQMLTQIAAAEPGWAVGILRYFNPAGAHGSGLLRQAPKNTDQPPENLMPRLLEVAHGTRPHLQVFGDDWDTPDGTGVRDYIHIEDLCRGHVLSLGKMLETGQGHTVNLGTGEGYSVLQMIAAFAEASGLDIPYRIAPRRPGDIGACWADVRRAQELLGFEARFGLAEMCASDWAVTG